jgi:glutamine amidotransferase
MSIAIIDYGAGNIHSLQSVISKISTQNCRIITDGNNAESDFVILPGVGNFNQAMEKLVSAPNLINYILNHINKGKKFLGICVGMQILADIGYENGRNRGLGLIKGEVKRIPDNHHLKIPHIGWNNIFIKADSEQAMQYKVFHQKDFYFVHSYYFSCKNSKNIIANVNYGIEIPAIIAQKNILATQFHPEKSGDSGLEFLRNFLTYN